MALIVVSALSISTAGLASLVTSNEHAFGRDRQEERAFNIAEAGVNYALSSLSTLNSANYGINSTIGSSATPNSFSVDSGTGGWWALKTAADKWTVYSKATLGAVRREVSVQVSAPVSSFNNPPSLVWSYGFFVADPTGCTNMVGTSQLTLPVFIAGDLCLSGTQNISEPSLISHKVTLYVGGKLTLAGSSQVGTPVGSGTGPIVSATVVKGCFTNKAQICSNSSQSKVYADAYYSTPSALTKPPVDPDGTYAGGDWNHPVCTTGSFTFDNNNNRDTSLGTVDILTPSSYNCTVYKTSSHVAGNEEGTLAWNSTTKTLSISGVIYIDGNLDFAGGDQAQYTGFGTVYVDGTVKTNGNSAFCGPGATMNGSSCNGVWDGSQGAIFVVAVNHNNAATTWQMNGNAEFNVGCYVVGTFSESGTAKVTGPVTTDRASVAGTPDQTDVDNPPPGTPGAGGTTTTSAWGSVIKGTWQQLPAG